MEEVTGLIERERRSYRRSSFLLVSHFSMGHDDANMHNRGKQSRTEKICFQSKDIFNKKKVCSPLQSL